MMSDYPAARPYIWRDPAASGYRRRLAARITAAAGPEPDSFDLPARDDGDPDWRVHGTRHARRRHRRAGEPLCAICRFEQETTGLPVPFAERAVFLARVTLWRGPTGSAPPPDGAMGIDEAAARLRVSSRTILRDLRRLEEQRQEAS